MTYADEDSSPDALLAVAREVAGFFAGLYGAPEDIAASGRLSPRNRLDLHDWLTALEQLVRCILFLLAIPLAKPPPPAPIEPAKVNKPERTGQGEAQGDPQPPRAHFRYWRKRRFKPDIIIDRNDPASLEWRWIPRPPSTPLESFDAAPIARRYEALLRVLEDPARYAQRLASLLPRAGPFDFSEPRKESRSNPCRFALQRGRERLRDLAATYWPPDPDRDFFSSA